MGISEDSRGKTLARVLAGEAAEPPVQCLRHWPESRSRGCKSGLSLACAGRELACPNTERKVVLCADSGRGGDELCLRPAPVREFVCA